MKRKDKLKQAKELLNEAEATSSLNVLTAKELDKLKQHEFNVENFINNKATCVISSTQTERQEVCKILDKIKDTERTVVHLSRFHPTDSKEERSVFSSSLR